MKDKGCACKCKKAQAVREPTTLHTTGKCNAFVVLELLIVSHLTEGMESVIAVYYTTLPVTQAGQGESLRTIPKCETSGAGLTWN